MGRISSQIEAAFAVLNQVKLSTPSGGYFGPPLGDLIRHAIQLDPLVVWSGIADPTIPPGIADAATGDIYLRNALGLDGGELWIKATDSATGWQKVTTSAAEYWNRVGTTITPKNLGDIIDLSGSDTKVSNLNAANNLRLDLNNTTALYQKDKTDLLYHQVIYYDDDNNVRLGGVNMHQVAILNDKFFSGASNGIPLVPFLRLAGTDTSNRIIFGDINANTLQFKVGGLSGAVAAEILNGGNLLLSKQLKIGSPGGTVMAGEIDIVDAQMDAGSGTAGIGIASYRNTDIWGSYIYGIRYRGTLAAPTACLPGDSLMEFGCLGWDGSAPVGGGELMWIVDGPVSGGVVPARAELYVTKLDGTFTPGLKIDSALKLTGYGDLDIAGELKIKVHAQAAEPTLSADEFLAIWKDTDDSDKIYLVFRRGAADQVKVQLM